MAPTSSRFETRRLAVFLLVAFGIAWLTAGVIFTTGGLTDSTEVLPGLTLAAILLPTAYMFAPAVGNVLARVTTGEGWEGLMFRPRLRESLGTYAAVWLVPAVLTLLGSGLFYVLFPRYFDPSMAGFAAALSEAAGVPVDATSAIVVQVAFAVTLAPLVNAVFAFGEEFGWRAYLLPKLLPLGTRRAVLIHGLIWGVWHWPVIAMGYEYGFGYPGAPWTGLVVFLVFTVSVGTFLAWATLRTGSVWPAAVGHGAVNAITAIGIAFIQGQPNLLLGPVPHGLVAGVPWLALAAYLLFGELSSDPSDRETTP